MMAITLCGRNSHAQVLFGGLQALLGVQSSCKATTFQTMPLQVLQVPRRTHLEGGTKAQDDRRRKCVWRCFTSPSSAFIFLV